MKAARTTLRAVLWVTVAAAALVALGSCPNPVADLLNSKSWGLLGTWVNSTHTADFNPGTFYKLTVRSDGTFRSEDQAGGMFYEGTYTVDGVTVSGNIRTFRVHYDYAAGTADAYVLCRVTDGTTYESAFTGMLPYPTVIPPPGDANYFLATLQ
jgi:hypothetical protein